MRASRWISWTDDVRNPLTFFCFKVTASSVSCIEGGRSVDGCRLPNNVAGKACLSAPRTSGGAGGGSCPLCHDNPEGILNRYYGIQTVQPVFKRTLEPVTEAAHQPYQTGRASGLAVPPRPCRSIGCSVRHLDSIGAWGMQRKLDTKVASCGEVNKRCCTVSLCHSACILSAPYSSLPER